jgi:transcriptional regulator with XRE-family HTH domain
MEPQYSFNVDALQMALDMRRKAFDLNWAGVAEEAKVSKSTISPILQGKKPDADTLVKLVMWSGVSFNHLVKTAVGKSPDRGAA